MGLTRLRVVQGLAAAATLPWWPAPAQAQTTPVVRAAMIPNEPAALIYYASENGYFTKAGLDVEITQNASTPAIAAAVAAGTYDIAFANISTLAVAHVRGLPFVCIAPGAGWQPGKIVGSIMVANASTVKTGKDFNGKTFATPGLGTIGEFLPRAWIDKHGGDSSTVKFVEIPFPLEADALTSGRVDAGYMVEPFLTTALKSGTVRSFVYPDDALGTSYLATVWFAAAPWAKAHPDLVARFVLAMRDAGRWANANPAKVVPILAKDLHADPVIIAQANRSYFSDRLIPGEVQPWIDVTAKYAKFAPFPASDMIYTPPA
jgi:ABC-type nitrate/sulfonate/bicarbonate transport system substrate-binding protein